MNFLFSSASSTKGRNSTGGAGSAGELFGVDSTGGVGGIEGGLVSGGGPNGGRESSMLPVDIVLLLNKVYQNQNTLVFKRNNHKTSRPTWSLDVDEFSSSFSQ